MGKKREDRLAAVRKAMQRQALGRAPSVDVVQPEVRTDLVITVSPGSEIRDLSERIKSGELLGVYLVEWGYDVPENKWAEFHRWLSQNERALAKNCPTGIAYKGTYLAVFGPPRRHDGRYRTFWVLQSLAGIEHFGKGKSKFKELLSEFVSFRDRAKPTDGTQLYQIAAGTMTY